MSAEPTTFFTRARFNAGFDRLFDVVETDLLVWEATKEPRKPQAQVPLTFTTVTAESIDTLDGVVPRERREETKPMLARNDRAVAAVTGEGDFAGWVWTSRHSHRDPWSGLRIRLAADEAYGYALWVAPELRPKGVARALMIAMLHEVYADPGLSRLYGWVDRRNRESALLHRLLGFKDVQEVKRLRVLNRFGMQIPRSDRPAYGPLSKRGRHRADLQDRAGAADTDQR